ncbi:MAG: C45 family autoproteolytic acyltransferase/hydrolase [Solirubrobacterales bacterium]
MTDSARGEMKRITLEGDALMRGREHGAVATSEIDRSVEIYRRWFADMCSLKWGDAVGLVRPYWEAIQAQSNELATEISGIAEGAGRPVEEIAVLNCRTELAYGASGLLATECTSLGVSDGAADGSVYVAENWDWLPSTLDTLVLLDVKLPDGRRFLTFTEGGMVGKIGVSNTGLALCGNLLASDRNTTGVGFHTLARSVLEQRTILDGLWAVTGARRAGAGNFMLGAAEGTVANIEWLPDDFAISSSSNGTLAHANHFNAELPGLRDRTKVLPTVSPGTYLRQQRVESLLRAARRRSGLIDIEAIKAVLRDHRHQPEAICRHDDGTSQGQRDGSQRPPALESNLSVIFDLIEQEMHYTVGPPCKQDYVAERFPWAQVRGEPATELVGSAGEARAR